MPGSRLTAKPGIARLCARRVLPCSLAAVNRRPRKVFRRRTRVRPWADSSALPDVLESARGRTRVCRRTYSSASCGGLEFLGGVLQCVGGALFPERTSVLPCAGRAQRVCARQRPKKRAVFAKSLPICYLCLQNIIKWDCFQRYSSINNKQTKPVGAWAAWKIS